MDGTTRRLSFVEALMCGAIILASAGVVVPTLKIRDMDERRSQIERDLQTIADGVRHYIDDTHTFPTGAAGATSIHFLYSDGIRPANNPFESGPGLPVGDFLRTSSLGGAHWRGPYMPEKIGPDPWGHAYIVNVNGFFSSSERTMVICAGPNGQINTAASATIAGGDDIMMLIE